VYNGGNIQNRNKERIEQYVGWVEHSHHKYKLISELTLMLIDSRCVKYDGAPPVVPMSENGCYWSTYIQSRSYATNSRGITFYT